MTLARAKLKIRTGRVNAFSLLKAEHSKLNAAIVKRSGEGV